MKLLAVSVLLMLVSTRALAEGTPADSQLSSRVSLSGGMGVEYVSAADIVDYVNGRAAAAGATQRVSVFKAGVGFFGALAYPVSRDLVLKAEYVYFLGSYNPEIPYVPSEFTLTAHMPSIILQYVLWDEQLYNIKVGGGFGYHFVSLSEKYFTVDDELAGNEIGRASCRERV
jgi:hypothetical protein